VQAVSGKNEQPAQTTWRGTPTGAEPNAAASVASALGRPWASASNYNRFMNLTPLT